MALFGAAPSHNMLVQPNATSMQSLAAASSQAVSVPGFVCEVNGELRPLSASTSVIPTPADDGIQPGPGDDTTAPNAVTAARLNRVVCVTAANVGYSDAAKDTNILPSSLEYDATVSEGTRAGQHALTLRIILEYASTFPAEGMVVWLKKHQQFINDEKLSQLVLVETAFEDCVEDRIDGSRWVPITTDMRYTEEAEAIVQAVITSDSGQTAGRVSTKDFTEDAKLGPVGAKGRIILTYYCDNLYSYAEMVSGGSANPQERSNLVPLGFQLPWAAIDNPGNQCNVKIRVKAPPGTVLLDPAQNIMAYLDLQKSLQGPTQCGPFEQASNTPSQHAVIPTPIPGGNSGFCGAAAWEFSRATLPPKPLMVLAWLSVPDPYWDWEITRINLPKVPCATIFQPAPEDEQLLRVGLPGNQSGQLYRCKVQTEAPTRQSSSVRVHTDIVISDASGSTGMQKRGSGGGSVRENFNKLEERRMLKRLEAIPLLRESGILLPRDVWRQEFIIFDHDVKHEFGFESKVEDLDPVTVEALVKALQPTPDVSAASRLQSVKQSQNLLQSWSQALSQLRNVRSGGATSFTNGAKRARCYYQQLPKLHGTVEYTSYVNFDTDGGNNCGSCYDAIAELVKEADVVQGHVMGIGSWVDQDCASKVARILKGTAELAMTFPEDAAADTHFRADLSKWIKVLRSSPISVKCSAGARAWTARHGQRNENAVDCVFASGEGIRFDEPDVSELAYTKSTVRGLMAGEATTMYIISRLPLHELERELRIEIAGVQATVRSGPESLRGIALGHHWLSLFGGKLPKAFTENSSTLCARLRNRIEDDLSFSWNLPTTSGSTAALGRAKTQNRPPVPKDKQPAEPEPPKIMAEELCNNMVLQCGAAGGMVGFGGGGFGAPPKSGHFQQSSAMMHAAPPGGGLFGAPPTSGGLFGAAPGGGGCSFGAAPSGGGSWGAAQSGGGLFGGAPGKGGLFGAAAGPLRTVRKEPATPTALLQSSGYVRFGPQETPENAAKRGLQAVKSLVQNGIGALNAPAQPAEDPLVASLLGTSQPAQPSTQAIHYGFTCDATGQVPIVGHRFKSTNTLDTDLNEGARKAGTLAGGSGYRIIATRADGMRMALAAMISWWWLLWPEHSSLFSQLAIRHDSVQKLATENEAFLMRAITEVPPL